MGSMIEKGFSSAMTLPTFLPLQHLVASAQKLPSFRSMHCYELLHFSLAPVWNQEEPFGERGCLSLCRSFLVAQARLSVFSQRHPAPACMRHRRRVCPWSIARSGDVRLHT